VIGDDVGRDLMNFARAEHATQLVVGATHRSRSRELLGGSVINRVIRDSGEIDVHVISQPAERRPVTSSSGLSARRRPQVSARRRLAGWLITLVGLPVVLLVLHVFDDSFNLTSDSLVLLLLVVVVAIVGGRGPALGGGGRIPRGQLVLHPAAPHLHDRRTRQPAASGSSRVAALISMVVSQATSCSSTPCACAEAEALARAGGLVGDDDPVLGSSCTSAPRSRSTPSRCSCARASSGWSRPRPGIRCPHHRTTTTPSRWRRAPPSCSSARP
jgi:two-component system sensor histidine kinase KdpD